MGVPAVGKRKWTGHYTDALRYLEGIANEAVAIRDKPHTARERALRVAGLAMAAQTATVAMAEIAEYQEPTGFEGQIVGLLERIADRLEGSET